ncbi:MAG: hypothetical protein AAF750_17340, partial [Planctomycetota bacterium]
MPIPRAHLTLLLALTLITLAAIGCQIPYTQSPPLANLQPFGLDAPTRARLLQPQTPAPNAAAQTLTLRPGLHLALVEIQPNIWPQCHGRRFFQPPPPTEHPRYVQMLPHGLRQPLQPEDLQRLVDRSPLATAQPLKHHNTQTITRAILGSGYAAPFDAPEHLFAQARQQNADLLAVYTLTSTAEYHDRLPLLSALTLGMLPTYVYEANATAELALFETHSQTPIALYTHAAHTFKLTNFWDGSEPLEHTHDRARRKALRHTLDDLSEHWPTKQPPPPEQGAPQPPAA